MSHDDSIGVLQVKGALQNIIKECWLTEVRIAGGLDPLMVQYNESIYFDKILYAQDIAGSIAFARANAKTGIITQEEFTQLEAGLLKVKAEWDAGTFKIVPGVDEDIHVGGRWAPNRTR